MHETSAQSQSANSSAPFFLKRHSKFHAINQMLVTSSRTGLAVTKSPTAPEYIEYSVRERHRHGQSVTGVTGCHTRAEAMGSSLRVGLAAIAIEKIVLAILRRIEECWQPCQEKADKGKQETYTQRLGHR